MGVISKIVTSAVLLSGSDARKHLDRDASQPQRLAVISHDDVNEALGTRYSPLVEASSDCPEMCLFKDQLTSGKNNSFCWKYKSPLIKCGWEWY